MTDTTDQPLPTKSELLRATGIALAVAIVILVTTILPAEYGVDPIGVGGRLGLDKLNVTSANAEEIVPDAQGLPLAGAALSRATTNLRKDALTVVVPAYEGVELKADMKAGQSLAFDWRTDGEIRYRSGTSRCPGGKALVAPFRWTASVLVSPSTSCFSSFTMLWAMS